MAQHKPFIGFIQQARNAASVRMSFRLLCLVSNDVSSAKSSKGLLRDRSFTIITNRTGPRIKPWGMPWCIFLMLEEAPCSETICFLFSKQFASDLWTTPVMPYLMSLARKISRETTLNALLRSQRLGWVESLDSKA